MQQQLTPTPLLTDTRIMSYLVAAHGNLPLAAERLEISIDDLYERLPFLNSDTLRALANNVRVLQSMDFFHVLREVMFTTLADLPAERTAKFFIEYLDRYEAILNPPVHGGSGPTSAAQVNLNFGDIDAARASLATRLIQSTAAERTDQTPAGDEPTGSVHAPVRLGIASKARATGADDSVEHLVTPDRTWLGKDINRGADNTP